jgi:hypothetical protein
MKSQDLSYHREQICERTSIISFYLKLEEARSNPLPEGEDISLMGYPER